ncbi:hypothetical protein [Bacillus sp. FJAT-22090]|uniref:hypothetical protein n=1 Tax=Bacillus sp. FJAT-22090 TaxID=1581038 RepID=UPI0011A6C1EA|nr:hypothetical protein [Bacillus sp. FJAT-22090]
MKTINEKLEVLYNDWNQKHPGHFVSGGVVDEDMFASCDVRILFLLKEVNDMEQLENWSLVQLMKDQIERMKFYRIWETVGLWSFGLLQGFPAYEKLTYMKEANIIEGLLNIAMTNLKKTGGSGESDMEIIKAHAIANKELWLKEIEIIGPNVVICGGTFSIVQELLGFEITTCDSGARVGRYNDMLFVEMYHPMYRISPKVFYAYFKETMIALGYK